MLAPPGLSGISPELAAQSLEGAPDYLPPLSPASESRRQKVLALLAHDGGRYAVAVDDAGTDPVVAGLATPDGTCEVLIPRDRYNPFAVLELVAGWNREAP